MSYIFDTNILMSDIDEDKYRSEKIYIPITVLEELDKNNHFGNNDSSYRARAGIRKINELGKISELIYVVERDHSVDSFLDMSIKDNIILSTCVYIQKEIDCSAVLLTRDLNMYQKAIAIGVKAKHIYETLSSIYKGYIEIVGSTDTIEDFFNNLDISLFFPNEYILIKDTSTGSETEMRWTGEKFVRLKLPESKVIKAKNALQRCALDLLNNKDITCAAILGGYGSGKTFLCTQMATHFVLDKKINSKILGIREPNGEGKDVGYLKGTFEDKTDRFFRPIEQQLKGPEEYNYLISNRIIETEIPFYMKGTTYDDTIFIVDEAEDLSEAQIKLIGTRVGENSRIFFAGDFSQSIRDKTLSNPLVKMCEQLKGDPKFGCLYLDEDVRSETSKMFANLFK